MELSADVSMSINLHGQALCSELGWWYATARGRLRVERESADVTTNFGCAIQEEVL